jgi:Dienelactone hydrolase family
MRRYHPSFERCEPRMLPTLVFVFNGNGFAASAPDIEHTQLAANELALSGDRAVQMPTPAMSDPGDFYELAAEIRAISKGQPIGLMGFSAGGGLAMRLSGLASLNVQAALSYYGPPDLRDWLQEHKGDAHYRRVTSHVQFDEGIINLLSGPSSSKAFVVDAFGLSDTTVVSGESTVSFDNDFPHGQVFYYNGPHGVSMKACLPAYDDFLAHL